MIYLWLIPEKYANRNIGEYNREGSPDRFLLKKGRILKSDEFPIPTVEFLVAKKNNLLKFDCLPNNALVPLVNNRVKAILENLAADDVQFFRAKLRCSDGELDGYYYLNITHTFIGIDHEKSICMKMKTCDAISGFRYLTYKNGCMGIHQLARDEEYKGNLLVSEKIRSIFEAEKITGVRLTTPEEYYPSIRF